MADLIVENLVLSAEVNQSIDLKEIDTSFPDATFDPDQLPAVLFYYHNPSRVVMITTQGKIVCTGSKTKEEASKALSETLDALQEKEIIKEIPTISEYELESVVISKNLQVSLPLASIQERLPAEQCTYDPSIGPWLEYRDSSYSMLLFPSGNIICTGNISLEESKTAFETMEDTLTSVGCKIAE